MHIKTSLGQFISVTGGHYLYVNSEVKAAKNVRVGDRVKTIDGPTMVNSVSRASLVGLYNPQTEQGDIVVDRIVASTYTTSVEMKTAHSLMLPMRVLFRLTGISTSLFENRLLSLVRYCSF